MKTRQYAKGSIFKLKDIINGIDARKIFLVTGNDSFKKSGAEKALTECLSNQELCRFKDFSVNPSFEDVEKGVELFKKDNYDAVFAIGGGSVIDMAKLIKVFSTGKIKSSDFTKFIPNKVNPIPFIAIPTTAGTGSEATKFAVLYKNGKKYSVSNKGLLPDYVLLDPEMTYSVPKREAASCTFDLLSQAVESFWSVKSTTQSRKYSLKAMELALSAARPSILHDSESAKGTMLMAAYLAGKAINIAKTTAGHALSYTLTSQYGIPHGHAVALSIGRLFVFNLSLKDNNNIIDPRGEKHLIQIREKLFQVFNCTSTEEWSYKWYSLMDDFQLENSLGKLGIKNQHDIEKIVDSVNSERLVNNPIYLEKVDLLFILNGVSKNNSI